MTNPITTPLEEVLINMTSRASRWSYQKGLFSGAAVDEELNYWVKEIRKILDEEKSDDPTYLDNWHEDADMGAR